MVTFELVRDPASLTSTVLSSDGRALAVGDIAARTIPDMARLINAVRLGNFVAAEYLFNYLSNQMVNTPQVPGYSVGNECAVEDVPCLN